MTSVSGVCGSALCFQVARVGAGVRPHHCSAAERESTEQTRHALSTHCSVARHLGRDHVLSIRYKFVSGHIFLFPFQSFLSLSLTIQGARKEGRAGLGSLHRPRSGGAPSCPSQILVALGGLWWPRPVATSLPSLPLSLFLCVPPVLSSCRDASIGLGALHAQDDRVSRSSTESAKTVTKRGHT